MSFNDDDNIVKIAIAGLMSFFGYCRYLVVRNNKKHDSHTNRLCLQERKTAVLEEQFKQISLKLDDVIESQKDLKQDNLTIIRQLVKNSKK